MVNERHKALIEQRRKKHKASEQQAVADEPGRVLAGRDIRVIPILSEGRNRYLFAVEFDDPSILSHEEKAALGAAARDLAEMESREYLKAETLTVCKALQDIGILKPTIFSPITHQIHKDGKDMHYFMFEPHDMCCPNPKALEKAKQAVDGYLVEKWGIFAGRASARGKA